jgi:hypothetical protein
MRFSRFRSDLSGSGAGQGVAHEFGVRVKLLLKAKYALGDYKEEGEAELCARAEF